MYKILCITYKYLISIAQWAIHIQGWAQKTFFEGSRKNEVQMPQQDVIQYIHESHVNITRAFLRQ